MAGLGAMAEPYMLECIRDDEADTPDFDCGSGIVREECAFLPLEDRFVLPGRGMSEDYIRGGVGSR